MSAEGPPRGANYSPLGGSEAAKPRAWGPLFAVVGVLGFSFKAILIKLAYASTSIDPVTLLTWRMVYSAPFFIAMAWLSGRAPDAPRFTPADWRALAWLGFLGYYFASFLDFVGL